MANQWFRMYSEFATDPKVRTMSDALQLRLVWLLCMRSRGDTASLSDDEIKYGLSLDDVTLHETLQVFLSKGFVDKNWRVLNWSKRQFISDSSTARVAKHRANRAMKQNETLQKQDETQIVTHQNRTEQNRTEQNRTETEAKTDHTYTKLSLKTLVPPAEADGTGESRKTVAIMVRKPKADTSAIWAAYPRKVGHRAAVAAVERAFARLTRPEGEGDHAFVPDEANAFLLHAVAAFARSPAGCAGEFTPHPATWFNQSRYLDNRNEWQQKGQNNGNLSKTESNLNAASAAIAIFAGREEAGYYGGTGQAGGAAAGQIGRG